MPKLRLTKENIARIACEGKADEVYWDTRTIGFGLRIRGRTVTYFVRARVKTKAGSKLIRINIGRHGVFTPDQAETQAKVLLAKLALGENPNAERAVDKSRAMTLRQLFDEYVQVRKLRPKSLEVYESAMRRCFGDWLDKRILEITKDMVQKRHTKLSNAYGPRGKGEAQANQAMRVLRSLLNYAAATYEDSDGKPLLIENPVKRLSQIRAWNKIPRRQDIIAPHELRAWHDAVMQLENATMRDYLLLCLFSGLRRTEAAMLKWKHIDLISKTLTIPSEDTKAGREHRLPLSDFLFALLQSRSKVRKLHNDFVFPAKTGGGYLVEPRKAINAVTQSSGVVFSMHTLRRTFETTAERLDISYYALKRLINHSTANDVTAGYIVIDVERLRNPMQKITDYLRSEMARSADEVVHG